MANFLHAYRETALSEGGYSNNQKDRGGETYAGISRVYWPDWEGWPVIDEQIKLRGEITPDVDRQLEPVVMNFYYRHFWLAISGDDIPDQDIANYLYDTQVNQGGGARALQRALNGLNRGGRDYPDVFVDGKVGPVTLSALDKFLERREHSAIEINGRYVQIGGKWILLAAMGVQKWSVWARLVRNDESQEDFANGWAIRGIQEIANMLTRAGVLK